MFKIWGFSVFKVKYKQNLLSRIYNYCLRNV